MSGVRERKRGSGGVSEGGMLVRAIAGRYPCAAKFPKADKFFQTGWMPKLRKAKSRAFWESPSGLLAPCVGQQALAFRGVEGAEGLVAKEFS